MMYEVIWHGRGGQGVVLAAQMLAEAAYIHGFPGVTATPTFGPERRGAPVVASTRISPTPIRTFSAIRAADIALCLDDTLLAEADIISRLKPLGIIIINTPCDAGAFFLPPALTVAVVNAAEIAHRHHLLREGAPVVNTPLLGALARVSGLVTVEDLAAALEKKLPAAQLSRNLTALTAAYEETVITHGQG